MGGPFTLQFANHFIIYQKRPFKGRFGTGRLHSELWAWGVKIPEFESRTACKFDDPNCSSLKSAFKNSCSNSSSVLP